MYSISFQEDSLLPRERLAQEGVEALSNQELLAILLQALSNPAMFLKPCTGQIQNA